MWVCFPLAFLARCCLNKHCGLSLFFQVGANFSISIILLLLLLLCPPSPLLKSNSFDTSSMKCRLERHYSILMESVWDFFFLKHNLFFFPDRGIRMIPSPPFRLDDFTCWVSGPEGGSCDVMKWVFPDSVKPILVRLHNTVQCVQYMNHLCRLGGLMLPPTVMTETRNAQYAACKNTLIFFSFIILVWCSVSNTQCSFIREKTGAGMSRLIFWNHSASSFSTWWPLDFERCYKIPHS